MSLLPAYSVLKLIKGSKTAQRVLHCFVRPFEENVIQSPQTSFVVLVDHFRQWP